jgi:hypothetical protein
LDEVGLAPSPGGRDVQSRRPDLGFLGASPLCCEYPRFWGLDFLGFSRANRDFSMGYADKSEKVFFIPLFVAVKEPSQRLAHDLAWRRTDCSWRKLNTISDFLQDVAARHKLPPEPVPSGSLHPKAARF